MTKLRETSIMRSVQAKLLVMLVVLSLPLLVISLLQLDNSTRLTRQQNENLASSEAASAAMALETFLERNPELAARDSPVDGARAAEIHDIIAKRLAMNGDTAIIVQDNFRRIVVNSQNINSQQPIAFLDREKLRSSLPAREIKWSDGFIRMTSVAAVEPFGWGVVVGLPPAESTPAGRAVLWLTITWAIALSASILLALWATSRFTKPLRQLAAAASTIGEGNLDERVHVETRDEVGTLAAALNNMAEDLQRRFHQSENQSAFIREVLDSLPLGVAVLDDKLNVSRANPMFARFVGRANETLTGRGIYEAAAGFTALRDVVEDVRRTRQPFVTYGLPLNLSATPAVPTTNETDSGGADVSYWDVIVWSISERKNDRSDLILILSEVSKRVRAERLATVAFAAERTRAAELSNVINQMNDGVVIVDRRGRYRINPAAARILAREPGDFRDGVEALIEDIALRNLAGELIAMNETPLRRALDKGETTTNERFKIVRHDNDERVLAMSVTPLVGEDGLREGTIAVFHDASESVRQHTELAEAYERLREHDRLKSIFFNKISHELRTPLNVILGMCQLLGREISLTEFQSESIERIERNARSLLTLVNDLLEYSRLEAGRAALHIEAVNVTQVISDAVAFHADEAREKKLNLSVNIAPDIGRVYTDNRKLEQVVANLVGNGLKFTMNGGVHVSAKGVDEERWMLEVRDTGIGMTEEEQAIIFDEFRQVDDRLARRFGGVGLGLAITNKIVQLMGGTISVESAIGTGSCFRVVWLRRTQPRTGTGSLLPANETAENLVLNSAHRFTHTG